MCDRDGYVYGSRPGIERAAMISWADDQDDPWHVLMSPDNNSSDRIRAPENDGRRIEEVSGGFRLLNFEYYRGLRNDDDRRDQNRRAQEKFRRKPESAKVSQDKPAKAASKPISDTEADADTKGERNKAPLREKFPSEALKVLPLIAADIQRLNDYGKRGPDGKLTGPDAEKMEKLKSQRDKNKRIAYEA